MRIHKLIIAVYLSLITGRSLAQNGEGETGPYHKFSVYAGAGPSYFFNNLVVAKDDVSNFKYAISARVMWEPQHSFVALGFETGYYRLYSSGKQISAAKGRYYKFISSPDVCSIDEIFKKILRKLGDGTIHNV